MGDIWVDWFWYFLSYCLMPPILKPLRQSKLTILIKSLWIWTWGEHMCRQELHRPILEGLFWPVMRCKGQQKIVHPGTRYMQCSNAGLLGVPNVQGTAETLQCAVPVSLSCFPSSTLHLPWGLLKGSQCLENRESLWVQTENSCLFRVSGMPRAVFLV